MHTYLIVMALNVFGCGISNCMYVAAQALRCMDTKMMDEMDTIHTEENVSQTMQWDQLEDANPNAADDHNPAATDDRDREVTTGLPWEPCTSNISQGNLSTLLSPITHYYQYHQPRLSNSVTVITIVTFETCCYYS